MAINETAVVELVCREANRVFDEKFDWFVKKTESTKILFESEKFIDDIVERINNKQLK